MSGCFNEEAALIASQAFWLLVDEAADLPAKRPHEASCKASVAALLNFKECYEDAGRVTNALSRDLAQMN